jgi:hypothetical protein
MIPTPALAKRLALAVGVDEVRLLDEVARMSADTVDNEIPNRVGQ